MRILFSCTSFLKKSFTEQPARPDEAQAHAQAHEEAQAQDEAQECAHEEWCDELALLFLDEPPVLLEVLLTGTYT